MWTNSAALNKTLNPSRMQLPPPGQMVMVTFGQLTSKSSSEIKYESVYTSTVGDIKVIKNSVEAKDCI